MDLIRPVMRDALHRWREVIGAGVGALFGLWLIGLGGLVLIPLGALAVALAAGMALIAWRRVRFAQPVGAPGVVEIVEGQIGYFGPESGGAIPLRDLTELRLLTVRNQRHWQLRAGTGEALLIPVEALGAERLFDHFATLPGLGTQTLVDALALPAPTAPSDRAIAVIPHSRVIWRHPTRAALT